VDAGRYEGNIRTQQKHATKGVCVLSFSYYFFILSL